MAGADLASGGHPEEAPELISLLRSRLITDDSLDEDTLKALRQLRVLGRTPSTASAIYCRDGLETLSRYAFHSADVEVSREAMRCLANALLLEPSMRQIFVDLGNGPKAAEKLKAANSDDEFLAARLLFLTTYGTNASFDELFERRDLAASITNHIERHRRQVGRGKARKFAPADELGLCETLKLLFNVTTHCPDKTAAFTPTVTPILDILKGLLLPIPPIQQPINYLINALLNLDLQRGPDKASADHMIHILHRAVLDQPTQQLESCLIPLLTLLRKICGTVDAEVKRRMQELLLPSGADRDLPLGESDSLASRLLKLSATTTSTQLRDAIGFLLFDLSESDPETFVRNIGYGHAAGFLVNHNMSMPESAKAAFDPQSKAPSEAQHTRTSRRASTADQPQNLVNPVTGQRLDAERPVRMPEMTNEQKEREAERLFVLFQRLEAAGIAKHPVREALEQGRLEELPDSDSET
ncbi:hypothetical protein KEM52_002906 [Ascosphaera acerosa]|nr:hypothetical protein KEM52_002906 [Ascosphaera acerosa]